jgi:drug/metabolite transporter (DMT)-like permease
MAKPSASRPVAGHLDQPVTGVALVLLAVLVFSSYNALGKWLAATYSPWQIMFYRGLFALLPFVVYAVAARGPAVLRSRQPALQLLRGVLGFAANLCFIFAYREMALADAVAISYAAPIFIVALSLPLLAERVGPRRALAAVAGFLGVLLVSQPGGGLLSPGVLYALAGTLSYALMVIATRRLGARDDALCTVAHSSAIYAGAGLLALPQVWVSPTGIEGALLVGTGLLGGTGMYLFVQAYRRADAALLAPFDYTAMLWAAAFGYLIWGEVPAPLAVAGMAVIAGSGLYLGRLAQARRT